MEKVFFLGLIIVTLLPQKVHSQNSSDLLGKWDVEFVDSKEKAVYEFKYENNILLGYCISFTDEKGKVDLEVSEVLSEVIFEDD